VFGTNTSAGTYLSFGLHLASELSTQPLSSLISLRALYPAFGLHYSTDSLVIIGLYVYIWY